MESRALCWGGGGGGGGGGGRGGGGGGGTLVKRCGSADIPTL